MVTIKFLFNGSSSKSKGFVISFDSLLALVFLSLLMSVTFLYLSQLNTNYTNDIKLIDLSNDLSISFEKSNLLSNLISTNYSPDLITQIKLVLNNVPVGYCADLTIYNSSNDPIFYMLKDECLNNSINTYYSSRTMISKNISNNFSYNTFTIGVWTKNV
ncbi:MAG: hypothetical protein PHQ98_02400 [Candidatus ainarchaeum sp.]|nr:hypothetical protein [Candidatus ainarchaeum sp.]